MAYILGRRLKELIKEKGMEQQEAAIEMGLKVPTFNGYISSKREPSIPKLIIFANYFNVSIDYLIGHSNVRDPHLKHLTDDMIEFIVDERNTTYLELAKDIKNRTKKDEYKKA